MSKRYTDTDKWKKIWFRKLKNDHKVFWMYVLDQCDHAGIWEVDFELASYFCNGIKESEIRKTFVKQYHEFDDGKRWFIKDFIEFQYRGLDESNRVHNSVINILKRHGLFKGLIRPLYEPKAKDKDKDQLKDKDKDKEKRENSKKNQLKKIGLELDILQAEFDAVDVSIEFDKFQDYLKANGKRYANYKSAFRNWLRSDFIKPKETYEKNIYTGSKFKS
jgi:hypothetical protein